MIVVTNLRDLTRYYADEYMVVMRSMKYPIDGVIQVTELSPSKDLFFKYLNWSKAGQWNQQVFDTLYVPEFLQGIKENREGSRDALNSLFLRSKHGETIVIGCVCVKESLCHRCVLAGLLNGAGCEVSTDTGEKYLRYWEMYQRL